MKGIEKCPVEQRTYVAVHREDKTTFDKHKKGLYAWQLFARMLRCYKLYGHLLDQEDIAA